MGKYNLHIIVIILLIITGVALYATVRQTHSITNTDASSLQSPIITNTADAQVISQDQSNFSENTESDSDYLLRTRGYPKEVSLGQAVEDFNRRAQSTKIGKTQPPLTVEEVVAAIHDWHIKNE